MKIRFLFLMIIFFIGCYNESDITPTEGDEKMFALPQGNHDYDEEIVAWRDSYGFYTLYLFHEDDMYWNNTNWDERIAPGLGGVLVARPADANYVKPALEMFKESFLELYPEDFIRDCMPLKIFLCSELWSAGFKTDYSTMTTYPDSTRIWAYRGYDFIAMNGVSQELDTMGMPMKLNFLKDINKIFMNILVEKGKLVMPEEFGKVSTYVYTDAPWGDLKFQRGFLNTQTMKKDFSVEKAQGLDFGFYIQMVLSYSMAELEGEPAVLSQYSNDLYLNYTGVLNPKRDSNGLVRKKYEIIVDYIENDLGIDLSLIRYPVLE